jgi:uncharacterized protein YndB with AHSA1/START domain
VDATITRTFEAAPEHVWAALVDPALLVQWFGHDGITTTAAVDARPGGAFTARMVNDTDGSVVADFVGSYPEVDPPSHLVQVLQDPEDPGDPNVETIEYTIRDLGGGRSELTYHQTGRLPDEQYGMIEQGVNGFYDRLARVLSDQ